MSTPTSGARSPKATPAMMSTAACTTSTTTSRSTRPSSSASRLTGGTRMRSITPERQAAMRSERVIWRRKIRPVSRKKFIWDSSGRCVVAERAAGEGEEHVVEGRAGQLDRVDGNPAAVQRAHEFDHRLLAVLDGQPEG